MPTTANNETLERIRAGKLAIENDGTKEQLQDITTLIWPNDGYPSGNRKYYQTKPDEGFRWLGYTYTNLPTIKATDLLAMIEDKENVYEVYYNGKWHIETEENYKELVNNANCYGRINGINQGDIIDATHSDTEVEQKDINITQFSSDSTKVWPIAEPVSPETQEELWKEVYEKAFKYTRQPSLMIWLYENFTITRKS